MKNSPHRTIKNPRADACLRAERRGDLNIEAFTASMFSLLLLLLLLLLLKEVGNARLGESD